MDLAARGASALATKDFGAAVKHYTDAISQNPGAVDYYIKRSTAYTRLSPPDHKAAFEDAETALALASKRAKRELITQAQLRRAITLFGLERYADAERCLQWVKKLDEKEKSLAIWDIKIKGKLKGLEDGDERAKATVTEIPEVDLPTAARSNDNSAIPKSNTSIAGNGNQEGSKTTSSAVQPEGVQTPTSKIRHDWIQTNDTVIITLYCKGIPKDKATVDIKENSLDVSFPLPTGSDYQFSLDPLFSNIDRMKSYYKIMSTKAEFTLVKSTPGQKWPQIEDFTPSNCEYSRWLSIEGNESKQSEFAIAAGMPFEDARKAAFLLEKKLKDAGGPAYPTSSKSGPKNWDKLASDLSKRPKKNAKEGEEDELEGPGIEDEEGDPTNNFFKTLYKGADPDTQRAMMKSYQESNGTALSTNWADVGKGPVETVPPDGMEAIKWGT